ncbi:hypothetical protein V2G26_014769 [Clonostachys chloroleuca]
MTATMHGDAVPGTLYLINIDGNGETVVGKTEGDIQLYPRPSNNSEDPLNWSSRRKTVVLSLTLLWVLAIGSAYAFPFSLLADITHETGISTTDLVQASGILSLTCGWGCLIWQPVVATYGRRGMYVLSLALCVPLTFWCAYLSTAWEWYVVRILYGLAMAPIETLPEVTIADVCFAHQRGTWISFYVVALFGSTYIGPLISGWLTVAIGWRNTMMFIGVACIASLILVFFFMEETMFIRKALEGLEDEVSEASSPTLSVCEAQNAEVKAAVKINNQIAEPPTQKKTYFQKLALYCLLPGRPTVKQMFRNTYMPLVFIIQFPIIAWCGFIYGINISWFSVMNSTTSPILSAAPYNFSSGLVGSMYAGPIVGTLLGCWWAGWVVDYLTLKLARRNGGVREPEHRLWPLAVSAVLSCAGLIMYGVGAQHQAPWIVLAIGLALLTFAVVTGSSIALSYNIDCFKDICSESITSVIVIRNTMGFAFSYAITPWYTNMGLQNCFIMAGFLSLGSLLTFLVFTWKGKTLRKIAAPRYYRYIEQSFTHE